MKKTLAILLLAFLLGLALSCQPAEPSQPTPTFRPPPTPTPARATYLVRQGNLGEAVQARGKIVSERTETLFFEAEGWIKTLKVSTGTQVDNGDLLIALEVPGLDQEVERAKIDLEKANLLLQQQESVQSLLNSTLVQRNKLWENYYQVLIDTAPSQAEKTLNEIRKQIAVMDTAVQELQLQQTKIQVEIAKEDLKLKQQTYDSTKKRLDRTQLRAPFPGIIVSLDKRLGDSVKPFEPLGTIADPKRLLVEASVLEANIASLRVDQSATIILDAYPLSKYQGRVSYIDTRPIRFQGKNAYTVRIAFDEGQKVPEAITMGVEVTITSTLKTDVLKIPSSAIVSDGERLYVQILSPQGPQRTPVTLGVATATEVEVLSGLKSGDVILLP